MKSFNAIMMNTKSISTLAIAAAMTALWACTEHNGWTVEGEIASAKDSTLYVEGSTAAGWFVMDSLQVAENGKFSYTAANGTEIPSIYRLRMGNRYIYFPVDSIETVNVTATGNVFDEGYTLAGNIYASGFSKADSLINSTVAAVGLEGAATDPNLKRQLSLMINQDTTCLVSYYIVGKFVGNKPLYNPLNNSDVRMIANATNNFKRMRPDDPRASELEQRWYAARRAIGKVPGVTREAKLTARPDVEIKHYDRNGNLHDFNTMVTRGKPTVLSLTRYDNENSPAYTATLRNVYEKYSPLGLEIYQLAFDPDEIAWRRSAANMPWTAVWNAPAEGLDVLIAYNANPVEGNPVSFVFDSNGDLVERVSDPAKLDAALAKVF